MKLIAQSGDAFAPLHSHRETSMGEVRLVAQELEDLWHAFNLLVVGDAVSCTAMRKVQRESSTGSVDSSRVKMTLAIQVTSIDFDPDAGELRLGGTTITEREGVRLGSHHTLTLELNRPFSLRKEQWDSVSLERLRSATSDDMAGADLAAVLVQHGLAHVVLISAGMSIVKARLEAHIPNKGSVGQLLGAKTASG